MMKVKKKKQQKKSTKKRVLKPSSLKL